MNSIVRGKNLYVNGGVCVDVFVFPKIYFKVKGKIDEYSIVFDVSDWSFNCCTCEYSSFWGVNNDEKCYHVEACRFWLKNELKGFLNNKGVIVVDK